MIRNLVSAKNRRGKMPRLRKGERHSRDTICTIIDQNGILRYGRFGFLTEPVFVSRVGAVGNRTYGGMCKHV